MRSNSGCATTTADQAPARVTTIDEQTGAVLSEAKECESLDPEEAAQIAALESELGSLVFEVDVEDRDEDSPVEGEEPLTVQLENNTRRLLEIDQGYYDQYSDPPEFVEGIQQLEEQLEQNPARARYNRTVIDLQNFAEARGHTAVVSAVDNQIGISVDGLPASEFTANETNPGLWVEPLAVVTNAWSDLREARRYLDQARARLETAQRESADVYADLAAQEVRAAELRQEAIELFERACNVIVISTPTYSDSLWWTSSP